MNNTTTSEFGLGKSNINKMNQKIFKNLLSQREEQKIKHLLSSKSHTNLPPKTKQLNPIQLKKTYRPSLKRTEIDCEISSINNSNKTTIKNEHKEVYDFLKDLNMEIYFDNFIKNGINTEEKILYLNNDNLKLINIPYAHRARFLKKLKEIETLQNMKKTINEKGGLSKLKLKKIEKNSKYEEIIIPKEEDDIELNAQEQKDSFTKAILDYQKTHSKFKEEEENNNNNRDFFKTGINSMKIIHKSKFINRYSDNNINNNIKEISPIKEINIGTNQENNINNKKSIGIGEEPINDNINNNINIIPIEKGEYIENNNNNIKQYNNPGELLFNTPKQFFPLYKKKTLCYNCLHMILQEHCIKKFEKPFCSLDCLEIFEKKNVTNCNCCEKRIEIINSIPSNTQEKTYYCSPECLQKKEPNENNIINKSQNISPSSSETSDNVVDILDI